MLATHKMNSCHGAALVEVLIASVFFVSTAALILQSHTQTQLLFHALKRKEIAYQEHTDKKNNLLVHANYEQHWEDINRFGELVVKPEPSTSFTTK